MDVIFILLKFVYPCLLLYLLAYLYLLFTLWGVIFYVSLHLVAVSTVRMLINFVTQLLTISYSYNYRPYWTLLSAFTIVYNYPVDKCFIFRFNDAGYYFWKLSVQCLDLVSGAGSLVTSIGHLHDYVILLQWNPVNTVTNGPKKIGRINEGCFKRKCMVVFARRPKKWP